MNATAQTWTVIGLLLAVLAGIEARHHRKKRQRNCCRIPGLPVDGAPLNDRDRLILAQMEGRLNGTNCVCGCPRETHRHHRPGSDCSLCDCRSYRKRGWLRRFLERRGDSWGVRQVKKAGREAWGIHQDREAS